MRTNKANENLYKKKGGAYLTEMRREEKHKAICADQISLTQSPGEVSQDWRLNCKRRIGRHSHGLCGPENSDLFLLRKTHEVILTKIIITANIF